MKLSKHIVFKALFLLLTILALVLLMLPASKQDHILMAFSIVVSTTTLFIMGLTRRTEYVQLSSDVPSTEQQPSVDEARYEDQQPEHTGNEMAVADYRHEDPQQTDAADVTSQAPETEQQSQPQIVPSHPSETEQLRSFRIHHLEPLVQVVEQLDPFNIPEEVRKEVCRDLFRIAFLSMDITDLFTRPTTPGEDDIVALMSGEKSFCDVIHTAKPVNDNPSQTPRSHRNMKAILDSDGESYYWSGYRF